jgi:hypothetical protein
MNPRWVNRISESTALILLTDSFDKDGILKIQQQKRSLMMESIAGAPADPIDDPGEKENA